MFAIRIGRAALTGNGRKRRTTHRFACRGPSKKTLGPGVGADCFVRVTGWKCGVGSPALWRAWRRSGIHSRSNALILGSAHIS